MLCIHIFDLLVFTTIITFDGTLTKYHARTLTYVIVTTQILSSMSCSMKESREEKKKKKPYKYKFPISWILLLQVKSLFPKLGYGTKSLIDSTWDSFDGIGDMTHQIK